MKNAACVCRWMCVCLLSCLTLLPSACKRNSVPMLRVAHNQGVEHPTHLALLHFKSVLEAATDHAVEVRIFPNEWLGGQRETVELTQTGAIDCAVVSMSLLESFNKIYRVFNLPYLFRSRSHFFAVMNDSRLLQPVFNSTESAGFIALSWLDAGSRNFYTSRKPVRTPADLKGLKIRVQQGAGNVRLLHLLGGCPIPMNYGDVYCALQQHVIDGAENNELALTQHRHGEVAPYYSYNQHTMIPDLFIVNVKRYRRLNRRFPGAMDAAATAMTEFQLKAWSDAVQKAVAEATAMGVHFYYPDIAAFRQLVLPMYREIENDAEAKRLIAAIRAKGEQCRETK